MAFEPFPLAYRPDLPAPERVALDQRPPEPWGSLRDDLADALTVEHLDAGLRRERAVLDQLRAEWAGTEPELGGAFGGPGTFTAYVPRNGRYRLADPRETILPAALRERIVRPRPRYADEPEDDGDPGVGALPARQGPEADG